MTFGFIKFAHLLSVILAVGVFSVQYFIIQKNFRTEDTTIRRASESIALAIGKIIGQPMLLLAFITGILLLIYNPVLLKGGMALHIKILFVVFLLGLSHMSAKRLKTIAAASAGMDEVSVNNNKKKLIALYRISGLFILIIIFLIVLKPF
ncbi:MAG: hypothetical protein DWQ05_10025 [Calditrichaeota bacterium]|nr:MAG: hypothetical protein DWQ05_10025 [Calditrichota bacterium]